MENDLKVSKELDELLNQYIKGKATKSDIEAKRKELHQILNKKNNGIKAVKQNILTSL